MTYYMTMWPPREFAWPTEQMAPAFWHASAVHWIACVLGAVVPLAAAAQRASIEHEEDMRHRLDEQADEIRIVEYEISRYEDKAAATAVEHQQVYRELLDRLTAERKRVDGLQSMMWSHETKAKENEVAKLRAERTARVWQEKYDRLKCRLKDLAGLYQDAKNDARARGEAMSNLLANLRKQD